jgi:hypothetical protein
MQTANTAGARVALDPVATALCSLYREFNRAATPDEFLRVATEAEQRLMANSFSPLVLHSYRMLAWLSRRHAELLV